jgi:hypothetical protein
LGRGSKKQQGIKEDVNELYMQRQTSQKHSEIRDLVLFTGITLAEQVPLILNKQ